jgi:hypothetical protein
MRSTPDLPVDPIGNLGQAIKPTPAIKPDTVKPFERGDHSLISDHSRARESIADTLRKKHARDEAACDFSDDYTRALLGCI